MLSSTSFRCSSSSKHYCCRFKYDKCFYDHQRRRCGDVITPSMMNISSSWYDGEDDQDKQNNSYYGKCDRHLQQHQQTQRHRQQRREHQDCLHWSMNTSTSRNNHLFRPTRNINGGTTKCSMYRFSSTALLTPSSSALATSSPFFVINDDHSFDERDDRNDDLSLNNIHHHNQNDNPLSGRVDNLIVTTEGNRRKTQRCNDVVDASDDDDDDIPPNIRQLIVEYATKEVTPSSLQTLISTGQGEITFPCHEEKHPPNSPDRHSPYHWIVGEHDKIDLNHKKLIQRGHKMSMMKVLIDTANYLCHEIPIRLAHRIHDLDQVPMMKYMPAVRQVKRIYIQSFLALVEFQKEMISVSSESSMTTPYHLSKPYHPSNDIICSAIDEERFATLITSLYQKHASVLIQMAKGAYQFRDIVRKEQQQFHQRHQQQQLHPNESMKQQNDILHVTNGDIGQYDNTALRYPESSLFEDRSSTLFENSSSSNKYQHSEDCDEDVLYENMKLCNDFLDRFYLSRIGIRVLVGQYIALRTNFHKRFQQPQSSYNPTHAKYDSQSDYVGMICQKTNPVHIVRQAANDATLICRRTYGGRAPMINIHGNQELTFPYIPTYLHYTLVELLKNSLRATMERHYVIPYMANRYNKNATRHRIPPVTVIVADGTEQEDVVIKIMDEGGGIKRSRMNHIWSYLYTTADPKIQKSFLIDTDSDNDSDIDSSIPKTECNATNTTTVSTANAATTSNATTTSHKHNANKNKKKKNDHSNDSPLAGLGYGLPISRAYCRYFGGDLDIISMEGYGTDTFIHLKRLGDTAEPIP